MNSAFPKTLLSTGVFAAALAVCQSTQAQEGQLTPPPQIRIGRPIASSSSAVGALHPGKQCPALTEGEQRKQRSSTLPEQSNMKKGNLKRRFATTRKRSHSTGNQNYRLAADVAKSHAVTALLQTAAQARTRGDLEGARAALRHAFQLDPGMNCLRSTFTNWERLLRPAARSSNRTRLRGLGRDGCPGTGIRCA